MKDNSYAALRLHAGILTLHENLGKVLLNKSNSAEENETFVSTGLLTANNK